MVIIQEADFDIAEEVKVLRAQSSETGAIVTFIGLVRDISDSDKVSGLYLEHYPGMTEKSIEGIVDAAKSRWQLIGTRVIHRVGQLSPSDQIVLVAVTSQHRKDAFLACEFIMDYLKTRAPFWKKEQTTEGERWLETRSSDVDAASQWQNEESC
ncbi:MAG: molybdopterin synthase catalytic subunit MoaE [Gammaproteobacteria bacterium]|nr:molybdopterin synthase catalytic subunit MoaE [Gammaproteobacteria bacterium]